MRQTPPVRAKGVRAPVNLIVGIGALAPVATSSREWPAAPRRRTDGSPRGSNSAEGRRQPRRPRSAPVVGGASGHGGALLPTTTEGLVRDHPGDAEDFLQHVAR